jgi:uncharacterized membrane protein
MSTLFKFVRDAHRFCVNHLAYPLVLSSLLSCMLFAGRVYLSRSTMYTFLIWNLFLAWIPYLFSLTATVLYARRPTAWWLFLGLGSLWLLFLPNAPYIITDFLHLDARPPVPTWYDIGMLAMFAWTGCFLGVVSLSQMQTIVRRFFGGPVSWLFALGAIGLSGLGIYLGRFLYWNSWDLFIQPQSILLNLAVRFVHPIHYRQTFEVMLLFATFLLVCYVTFVSIEARKAENRSKGG